MSISPNGHRHDRGLGPFIASATRTTPLWVAEKPLDTRAALYRDVLADAAGATCLRGTFTEWLLLDVAAGEQHDDMVLAVYEALANVAEHAYADRPAGHPDGPGRLWLAARRSTSHVRITITDQGCWRPPTGEPFRSRGLPLIRLLITHVHIDSGRLGTAVHLRTALRLAPPPPT